MAAVLVALGGAPAAAKRWRRHGSASAVAVSTVHVTSASPVVSPPLSRGHVERAGQGSRSGSGRAPRGRARPRPDRIVRARTHRRRQLAGLLFGLEDRQAVTDFLVAEPVSLTKPGAPSTWGTTMSRKPEMASACLAGTIRTFTSTASSSHLQIAARDARRRAAVSPRRHRRAMPHRDQRRSAISAEAWGPHRKAGRPNPRRSSHGRGGPTDVARRSPPPEPTPAHQRAPPRSALSRCATRRSALRPGERGPRRCTGSDVRYLPVQ